MSMLWIGFKHISVLDPNIFQTNLLLIAFFCFMCFHKILLQFFHSIMAAVHIYAGVAASLAERKKSNQLAELLRNIKGTIEDDDWDQVCWNILILFHWIFSSKSCILVSENFALSPVFQTSIPSRPITLHVPYFSFLFFFFPFLNQALTNIILGQVLGAAINVYANRHRERPTGLIDKLSSNHRCIFLQLCHARLDALAFRLFLVKP